MKEYFSKLLKNKIFIYAMNILFGYLAFSALVMASLEVPTDAIENSNLHEVNKVFEDDE